MHLVVGPAFKDLADVPVGTGLCSWQPVSALCAGHVMFSEFLPVFSPEMIVPVARGCVFLSRTYEQGWICSCVAGPLLLPTTLSPSAPPALDVAPIP